MNHDLKKSQALIRSASIVVSLVGWLPSLTGTGARKRITIGGKNVSVRTVARWKWLLQPMLKGPFVTVNVWGNGIANIEGVKIIGIGKVAQSQEDVWSAEKNSASIREI